MLKVTYLFNSGYLIELDKHILLFDYYKGSLPNFDTNKPLYIFSSHNHRDHFNPAIYQIKHPNIHYIIDEGIDGDGLKVTANQNYQINDLEIKTLLSTDLGVAFIVHVENRYLYHAGDLNWWDWIGEPSDFLEFQEKTFKQEIKRIKDIPFDIMMIPLDVRLEANATKGMQYILEHVKVKYVFPMHSFTCHKQMSNLLKVAPLIQYTNIQAITKRHQEFILEK